ncbi:FAD/NAD(P)-binding domain-containing protein, partial [Aureobasidium melanogenum]
MLGVGTQLTERQVIPLRSIDKLLFQGSEPGTGTFLYYSLLKPSTKEDSTCTVQINISWPKRLNEDKMFSDNASRLAAFKSRARDFAPCLKDAIDDIAKGTPVLEILLADWEPVRWTNSGSVTLAGDAAHPMTMFRGEAANHGILDAHDLWKTLKLVYPNGGNMRDAIRGYVRKAWNPHIKGKCLSVGPLFYGTAAATILCDLTAFSMPVSALLAIKNLDPEIMPRSTVDSKKTLRLTVSLFFGFFTTICSVVRTIQIREVVETGDSTMLILWGVIEACVGVITSSIPTLNAMFSGLWKSGTSATKKCHSTDRYCELPGTCCGLDDSVKLVGITCKTDLVMRSEVMEGGFQESSTRHDW